MKKPLLLVAISFLFWGFGNISAQEMIVGGDMETGDAWTVINCTTNDASDFNDEFGYTADYPSEGADGCYHAYGSNESDDVNRLIYQEITLTKGVYYAPDLAFKNTIDFNGAWIEVYVGEVAPVVGQDTYVENGEGITLLGGWKYSGWVGACSDLNDGTLAVDGCLTPVGPGYLDGYVFYEGTGDITVYFGVKFGLGWTTGPYEYDLMFDNISLMGPVSVEKSAVETQNLVYPNPATDQILLSNVRANEVQIFDIVGKKVYSTNNVEQEMQIDISGYAEGMYIVRLGETTRIFIKE